MLRSLRYGPLPHRPHSVKNAQPADNDDYHYYSTETVNEADEEKEETPVDSVPKTGPREDYGYMEFQGDNCSHEEVDSQTEDTAK